MGTLHGGVLFTIADIATGVVFATMLEEGEVTDHSGIEDKLPETGLEGKTSCIGQGC